MPHIDLIDYSKPQALMLWDTILDNSEFEIVGETQFDWNIVDGPGLIANAAIHASVINTLFTDRRSRGDDVLPDDTGDRRGWFGDVVNVYPEEFEGPMGSRIWLYERSDLTEEIAERVRVEAEEALQVFIAAGVMSRVVVTHEWDALKQYILLTISLYGNTSEKEYEQKFERLWGQIS